MKEILVSIIIPVYDTSLFIKECLDSAINQTYKKIEILVIDDGSTDNSKEIIDYYASIDNRIKIISRENRGLLYTRCEGVKKAKGKYIIFLDSDDWIEYDAVEILLKNIVDNDFDLVRCNYNFGENRMSMKHYRVFMEEKVILKKDFNSEIYKEINTSNKFNSVCMQIIKKEIIDVDNIDTKITMGEDLEFNLNIYSKAKKIKIIPNYLYNYRKNNSSITKQIDYSRLCKNSDDVLELYEHLLIFMKDNANEENIQLAYMRFLEKANFTMYRIIKNCYKEEKINNFFNINKIFNSNLLNKTNKEINNQYLKISKHRIFIKLILANKKNIYIFLLKIIRNFNFKGR